MFLEKYVPNNRAARAAIKPTGVPDKKMVMVH